MEVVKLQLRHWQAEKLNDAINALRQGKTLLLNAKPGLGKTVFVEVLGMQLDKKVLIFTRTHSQLDSVYKNAKLLGLKMGFLVGKSASCIYAQGDEEPDEINCSKCTLKDKIKAIEDREPSKLLEEFKEATDYCPYYSLKANLKDKDVIAMTYPYLFQKPIRNSVFCNKDDCLKLEDYLIVIDEAHNLLEADKWFARKISRKTLEKALKEIEIVEKLSKVNAGRVREYINSLINYMSKLVRDGRCHELSLMPLPNKETNDELVVITRAYLNIDEGPVKKSGLKALLKFIETEGELYNCNGSLVKVPSDINELIEDALNVKTYKILMSGTLPESLTLTNSYKIIVNEGYGRGEYYYCPNVTSELRRRISNIPLYAMLLKRIYESSSKSVLSFFPSYEMLDRVRDKLSGIPVIEENRRTKHEEVLELMKTGKYLVMLVMRAKESEGVEFRDKENLFESLVLAGLPYPNVSDDMVKKRIERLSKLTGRNKDSIIHDLTAIVIKQTIGRAFRDPNDFVKIYLCDSRYKEYFSDLGLKEKEIKLFV
ncbi:helicase C-terminal domain-containing protein [Sulfolobus acidocaldarius]|uniref:helicase C-terminal domain-containing protein n=1 Tax=Sulfolobus acidocaldarius TaxID=2285 RepID=UPI000B5A421F|nr:helicase C-terminal domain-containing protein [Sulfolobus acidocaldarius]